MPGPKATEALRAAEAATGYRFKDADLLGLALTHASVSEARLASNERLEFLGDAVLGLVVSDRIFRRFPDLLEGEMTKIKSSVVSRQACSALARQIGLDRLLTIGKGLKTSAEVPSSLTAAVFEAVVAAIFLDGGSSAAEAFIGPLVDPLIARAAACGHQENFKSVLQHHAQQHALGTPNYRVMDEKGPDHAKAFKVAAEMGGKRFEPAWGQSKKRAEQLAALAALRELGVLTEAEDGVLRVVTGAAADGAK